MTATHQLLPVAVQVGFAGARRLLNADPTVVTDEFHEAVEHHLTERLRKKLREDLKLSPAHFLCGISQVAIGADIIFSRAFRTLELPQRIFLPQHRDEYLRAVGSDGKPDFSSAERQTSIDMLNSPHVIQEIVVSDAPERRTRFEDVNLEIVRVSDVLVCLTRAGAEAKRGGALDLLERARKRGKPVLEIRVALKHGQLQFDDTWHQREAFRPPNLPTGFAGVSMPKSTDSNRLPNVIEYCAALKNFASGQANWKRKLFKAAALVIIVTHVLATIFAVVAVKSHGSSAMLWLLVGELILLLTGFVVHQYLHHTRASRVWALSRLVAEVARSVIAVKNVRVSLEYLFSLPFPAALQPLFCTMSILHLRSTRYDQAASWDTQRKDYMEERLVAPAPKGQIGYYDTELRKAKRRLHLAEWMFLTSSSTAIVCTLFKLFLVSHLIQTS